MAIDDITDQQSEDWSLVNYPSLYSEPLLNKVAYPREKDHMVSAWLDTCCSVAYEISSDSNNHLLVITEDTVPVELDSSYSSQLQYQFMNKSLSAASFADFLSCVEPCRPSFLDRKSYPNYHKLNHQPPSRKKVLLHKKSKHITDIKQSNKNTSQHRQEETNIEFSYKWKHSTKTNSTGNQTILEKSWEKSSAENLSHALYHFSSFNPLDFTPQSEASSNITTLVGSRSSNLNTYYDSVKTSDFSLPYLPCSKTTQNNNKSGVSVLANVWSFLSGVLEDLTCDATFIH
ncbi:hypothetical protein COEREDRAFT_89482 [Coemansia reversa NRRL 1564]|uniref:Uncharacterized protein n=1 Tax=Coemansia reversa (strain ATCC 12441 / NRRL 1564) TaxID=763665 RepID=A0A2G5B3G0_COERN|nr:hypothetical protein COEREDRAFT_89482 [Coemansia reversa NRRL 1564]|eukprot:PIA13548.1 hypothetical protein COEREDRAFT_89482 [Coemansia reversa NRRL 1564]